MLSSSNASEYRVAFVVPTIFFSPGAAVRIYTEAKSLAQMKCNVEIFTYAKGQQVTGLTIRRIFLRSPYLRPGPDYHRVYLDGLLALQSWKWIRKSRPMIVHAHLHEGAVISKLATKGSHAPIVVDLQGSFAEEIVACGLVKPSGLRHRLFCAFEESSLRISDAIICSSPFMKNLLSTRFPDKTIITIPDCIDTSLYRAMPKSQALLHELRLEAFERIVVYLGTLSRLQGTDVLIESIPKVIVDNPKVGFLIIGHGIPSLEYYRQGAKRLGIDRHVRFTGQIDYFRAPEYVALGDMAVSPKRLGTQSNAKLLSYMAMGLPTLAFDNTVNRYYLGAYGIYAREEDPLGFGSVLAKAIGRIDQYRVLAESMQKRVRDLFSTHRMGQDLMRVYSDVS